MIGHSRFISNHIDARKTNTNHEDRYYFISLLPVGNTIQWNGYPLIMKTHLIKDETTS